jgi:transposase
MTYSIDFRRKILSIRQKEDLAIAEVVTRFGVGIATVVRWLKRLEPHRTRYKPPTKIDRIALARDVREYLPAYSPDLNPIEQKWAHAKAKRKKYRCSIEHRFKTKLNHFI